MKFDDIGLLVPDILLPVENTDMQAWSVVACDQYSSQPGYWQQVESLTENKPSTGHLIFPEVYLEEADSQARIDAIHYNMRAYLQQGLLKTWRESLVLCERTLANGRVRKGLMVALDLEAYSYQRGEQSLIRSTEGTIVERLPARVKIRNQAALELPHIMVLIDDPEKTLIEDLFNHREQTLYDFELMLGAGHLRGDLLSKPEVIHDFAGKLSRLAEPETFNQKYGCDNSYKPMLFAMGDGNHSFASAKAIWQELKQNRGFDAVKNHPARYALVELVNLYDDSLEFEPIHRVMFNTDTRQLLDALLSYYANHQAVLLSKQQAAAVNTGHTIPFFSAQQQGVIHIGKPSQQLAAGSLQVFLDDFLAQHTEARIDYIHGEQATRELAAEANNLGFLLPPIDKHSLFKTVIFDGALPRKTFSMGEAEDKRFYLEARKILPG